jgi:signal transduction histidine kinase
VRSDLDDEKLDRDVATTAFRVVQEALTNVARHAEARHVQVRMDQDDGELVLQVRDDGRGIDPSLVRHPRSLGLLGIRERARRLGGTASFERLQPGTLVTLRVPLRPAA